MQDILQLFVGTRVLITGATGFTGQLLARTLVEAGAEVRAVARASSRLEPLSDLDVEWFRGEVYDEDVLTRAAEGVNYIFHVAAAFREEKATDEDYRKVHLYSTQTLARLVTGRPEFKRMVHISTVGVHGHIEVDRADENYRFAPGDGYQRTKLEGEQWLLEYGKTHDLPFAIVRPTPIYGPGDMRLLKFFKMADKGFTLMLGSGRGMYHLVHVRDLVNVLLLAAIKKEALGEVFIAAADDPISIIDMGKAIGKAIGKTPRVIRLPIWPFYAAADVTKAVCKPFGIPPPIYRRRVGFYAKDRQFDNGKIKQVLGYTPLYDNETGLAETARWYQEQGLISA